MKPEWLTRILQPLSNRLANLATLSRVISVDSSKTIFVVLSDVKGKPNPEDVPMIQHFGFASVPPVDSKQVRVHISGDPDNPLMLASIDEASQPSDLESGDSALFDNRGQYVKIQADGIHIVSPEGNINLTAPNGNVNLTAPNSNLNLSDPNGVINATAQMVNFSGNATFGGIVKAVSFELSTTGLTLENHKHNENNVLGGPTDGPINVV